MFDKERDTGGSAVRLNDIYFILFRHKWTLFAGVITGLLLATGLIVRHVPKYMSEAKLLVRYVMDTPSRETLGSTSQMKSPDARGENIINSEVEILTSLDLAEEVVEILGAEKILGNPELAKESHLAAVSIIQNLEVDVPRKSNVLRVVFRHKDPEMAQTVLRILIDRYLEKHLTIHRSFENFDFLSQQTDQLRVRLGETEEELRRLKLKAGVVSFDARKEALSAQLERLSQEYRLVEAEVAENQARLSGLETWVSQQNTNQASSDEGTITALPDVTLVRRYRDLRDQQAMIRKRELDLMVKYTPSSTPVRQVRDQMAPVEKEIQRLEAQYPSLFEGFVSQGTAGNVGGGAHSYLRDFQVDLLNGRAAVAASQAKMETLQRQVAEVKKELENLDEFENSIRQLERRRALEETKYRNFSESLELARIEDTMDFRKISNISKVQEPTASAKELSGLMKSLMMALLGCGGLGLAVAFGRELVFDDTIKRPVEVEKFLRLPLCLSIPELPFGNWFRFQGEGMFKGAEQSNQALVGLETAGSKLDMHDEVRPYFQALRDHIVLGKDEERVEEGPKLIGLTSCGLGAGVTTLSSGIALTLSQNGDGSVLLVDMNFERQGPHPLAQIQAIDGLMDSLLGGEGFTTMIQKNLFLLSGGDSRGYETAQISFTQAFLDLIPRLKTSNYDYIIFDMPVVNPTSFSPRLAGMLDQVFLVVESERSHREGAKRAKDILLETGVDVALLLNKRRFYLPRWLHEEV